jgi:hypothetical protein
MNTDELDNHVLGTPLQLVLLDLINTIPAKSFTTQALYRNKVTGGFFTLPANTANLFPSNYTHHNFLHLALINRRDEKALLALSRNRFILACFEDWLTNDLQAEIASDLTDLIFTACEETLESAINEITRLQPPEKEIQTEMALKGTLAKCVHYMALVFHQHHYDFLNIAFNGASHEYEMLTPAEVNTMKAANRWDDRRIVLTCSLYELEKLTTSPQLNLGLPHVEETDAQSS